MKCSAAPVRVRRLLAASLVPAFGNPYDPPYNSRSRDYDRGCRDYERDRRIMIVVDVGLMIGVANMRLTPDRDMRLSTVRTYSAFEVDYFFLHDNEHHQIWVKSHLDSHHHLARDYVTNRNWILRYRF
jgi:hypothetical protein